MDEEKGNRLGGIIWDISRYGMPLLILIFIVRATSRMGEKGQFFKFLLFDVLALNFFGVLMLLACIFTFLFTIYMIISKKAVNPKGVILLAIVLIVIFLALGFGLSHDIVDDFADVGNYLSGNIMEEQVVIRKFEEVYTTERTHYIYTFEDGRTFQEIYKGKGFGNVKEGETYYIRYLPRTNKLLRIERIKE